MASYDFKRIKKFLARWLDCKGYEKGETVPFWEDLQRTWNYPHLDTTLYEYHLDNGGFIDVWIRDGDTIIEQKSKDVDLDKPEPRQGKMKTPLEQALDYCDELKPIDQPRYIVTCNFETFRVYDRNAYSRSQLASHPFEFKLSDLERHPEYLAILADPSNARFEKEKEVSIKAGDLIGQLYDRLAARYHDATSPESMHALNVLCVRIVFCLFCEDADLFERDAFYNYLNSVPASYLRSALRKLFRVLDTPVADRDPYDVEDMSSFPYVNGGLFRGEVEIPNFDEEMKRFLLEDISAGVDWSDISPTIFGGIFESTLNPETRRAGGMHYTSPENIHKVIDPLFLDGLKQEYTDIHNDENLSKRQRDLRYRKLHKKICGLKFFDPACGSGNFLTETYLCLRRLEDAILRETGAGQAQLVGLDDIDEPRVSLRQFYGIEINDFAVTVAETALWISKLKANAGTMMLDIEVGDFPLSEGANIVHGNALRLDWNDVLPASECSYIMGNPPFYGASLCSSHQKKEIVDLFGKIKLSNSLDYVTGWYYKSCLMMSENSRIKGALVSTNSITQGEQVAPLWGTLRDRFGIDIDFAYRTFVWNSEATDQAHVHCVIIGFSLGVGSSRKRLYESDGTPHDAAYINPYLVDAPFAVVQSSAKPLSQIPKMLLGNKPTDDGNLILSTTEKDELLQNEPVAARYIRKYLGAIEFINNKERWCLWMPNATEGELSDCPLVAERVSRVREFRLKSSAKPTVKMADQPWRFFFVSQPTTTYLLFPSTSSQRRQYVPIGFMSPDVIASNAASVVADASIYDFGVATSQMHNAWLRIVGGRLRSDYRYTGSIVWNTFPWPTPTSEQHERIEIAAQDVLDARAAHPDLSLAQLYDPDKMPIDLEMAHKSLDDAVEAAYGVSFKGDEEKIVAHLFKLYAELTKDKK